MSISDLGITSVLPIVLILGGVAALAAAAYVWLVEASRRDVVDRGLGVSQSAEIRRRIRRDVTPELSSIQQRILKFAPARWAKSESNQENLIFAGYDGPLAPVVYSLIRLSSLVILPLLIFLFFPKDSFFQVMLYTGFAAFVGLVLPVYALHRAVRKRQEKIRRALPDGLDLLVVCVEAGISLDAALLRVARDLAGVHPDLSDELFVINRRTNAGMSREEALRGLHDRTGVEEVRALVASLIQSEKWGSSSARVLRVNSEALRRKRRQSAERRAATAPLKMLVPLGLLIFPALFVVILGPPALNIIEGFRGR